MSEIEVTKHDPRVPCLRARLPPSAKGHRMNALERRAEYGRKYHEAVQALFRATNASMKALRVQLEREQRIEREQEQP